MMVTCPACRGEGVHDCRDDDAWMGEHMSDAELARFRAHGGEHPLGIIPCDLCEGTGLVTELAARVIQESSRRMVAALIARVEAEEASRG